MSERKKVSSGPLANSSVAILGYGNQGRAHALNLRDSGVTVLIGARPGKGFDRAVEDGFTPTAPEAALERANVVMFLLPDQVIPGVYARVEELLAAGGKYIGFAHGFALHYGFIRQLPGCSYFLVGPKGAGAILRENFTKGGGLPGVYAIAPDAKPDTRDLALAYAKAIGCASSVLVETTFALEVEGDLFGEQAVLCGGLLDLIEASFETLVKNGHPPETAYLDVGYEAMLILRLWVENGPSAMSSRISPTANYGGVTRGPRVINDQTRRELQKIFDEVRDGTFAREWMAEVGRGMPRLNAAKARVAGSALEGAYRKLAGAFNPTLSPPAAPPRATP